MGIASIDAHPSVLLFILIVVSLVLIMLVAWLLVTFKRFRLRYENVSYAAEAGDLAEIIVRQSEDIRRLRDDLALVERAENQLGKSLAAAIQKVALVRFDAFDDVGGKLSFAAALLNDQGDGVVISSINGRQESRIYAKPVKGGESIYNLSVEEKEAIGQALK